MTHVPPKPAESPLAFAMKYINDQYVDAHSVHKGVCKFAAIELSAQPVIRNQMKNHLNEATFGCNNFWMKQIWNESIVGRSNFWMKQLLNKATFG